MMKIVRHVAQACILASTLACLGALAPAQAQFNDEQMKANLTAAEGMGQGQAAGDACGTDMAPMSALVARGWKCQGASADQLAKLQAAVADARKKHKIAACPMDKAAHAQQIAQTTTHLDAGLAKINCKG